MKFSKVFVYFVLGVVLGAGVAIGSAYVQSLDSRLSNLTTRLSNVENFLVAGVGAGR
jgi:hypothetical protein